MNILFSWLSIPRMIGVWLDALVFGLVDDAYNVIVALCGAELFNTGAVAEIRKSIYVIIGVFALFRLAVSLINTIIDPDKLADSKAGVAIILRNVVLMFVLLIITPMLFEESRNLQSFIVEGNYIGRILNTGTAIGSIDSNPGKTMQKIAIKSLIYPDSRLYDADTDEFDDACKSNCKDAINEYNAMMESSSGINWFTISANIGVSVKYEDPDTGTKDTVYAYHYYFLITLVFAGFLAYILYSFAIDIGIRSIKLVVLEIMSPLFIATMIDPKSLTSGPFHNWITTVGKTYVNLFIRLAVISLLTILVTLVDDISFSAPGVNPGITGLATIILLIAILIFIKSAPKWISGLLGSSEGAGDFGGLFKKIGGAALLGGAATKAGHAIYGAAQTGIRNAHAARKAQKKAMGSQGLRAHNALANNYKENRKSDGRLASAARAVGQSYFSKDARARNKGNWKNTAAAGGLGFLGGLASGASIGIKGGDLKDINAKAKMEAKSTFDKYMPGYRSWAQQNIIDRVSSWHETKTQDVMGSEFEINEREKEAKKRKTAIQKYGSVEIDDYGKRNKHLNPVNSLEVNNMVGAIRAGHKGDTVLSNLNASSSEDISKALVQARIDAGKIDKGSVSVVAEGIRYKDENGQIHTVSAMDYCKDNKIYTVYGQKDVEAIAQENAYTKASEYASNQARISQARQSAATANEQMLTIQANVKTTFGDKAVEHLRHFDAIVADKEKAISELKAERAKSVPDTKLIDRLEAEVREKETIINKLAPAANGFAAAQKVVEESSQTINKLTEADEEIRKDVDSVADTIKAVKAYNKEAKAKGESEISVPKNYYETKDITTGKDYTFLEDPSQIELVVNLLGRARDVAKSDAEALKPKDKE